MTIYNGTIGNDTLVGSSGNDQIYGLAGNDALSGGSGNDAVNGDDGNDSLDGGDGNDTLTGGVGDDTLTGGTGTDRFSVWSSYADTSVDTITDFTAGSGGDQLPIPWWRLSNYAHGNPFASGHARLTQAGADTLFEIDTDGSDGAAVFQTVAILSNVAKGDLVAFNFESYDPKVIAGTAAADSLPGTTGNDQIYGLAGNDTLDGLAGNDTLDGGSGNDVLNGGDGNDSLDGGDGTDTLSGGAGADHFSVWNSSTDSSVDTLTDFATGSSGDQLSIPTSRLSNYSFGGNFFASGHARLTQAGVDTLFEIDSDGPDGAAVFQTVAILSNVTKGDLVAFNFGDSFGSPSAYDPQMIAGTAAADSLPGTTGNDQIYGLAGNDTLDGLTGNDMLSGGAGDDVLNGGDGSDSLSGGSGSDVLNGGDGNDSLEGGDGTDTLVGGPGTDRFSVWSSYTDTSVDPISDFTAGSSGDQLSIPTSRLNNYNYGNPFASGHARLTQAGVDTRFEIDIDGPDGAAAFQTVAILSNVTKGDLVAFNFGGSFGFPSAYDPQVIAGTAAADSLPGTTGNDQLYGLAGNDTLDGLAGNDTLNGGPGNDVVNGGEGNDSLDGSDGNDTLSGGAGTDYFLVWSSSTDNSVDTISDFTAGSSGDQLSIPTSRLSNYSYGNPFASGHARLTQAGSDTLFEIDTDGPVGAALFKTVAILSQVMKGDLVAANFGGYDPNVGTPGSDLLTGSAGNDQFDGGAGDDTINGLAGSDTLHGGSGNDLLNGGSGSDFLYGDDGNDTLDGGADSDSVNYEGATGPVTVNLAFGTATGGGVGTDTLVSIEGAIGSQFADALIGSAGIDSLNGGGGNDTLTGGAGADYFSIWSNSTDSSVDTITDFTAGLGGDQLSIPLWRLSNYTLGDNPFAVGFARLTQSGTDTLLELDTDGPQGPIAFQMVAKLNQVTKSDLVAANWSGFDPNPIMGTSGDDLLSGTAADDQIYSLAGNDTVNGLAGNDILNGGSGNDVLDGGDGDDWLYARDGNDSITGGAGADELLGGQGVDTLSGGNGDDSLVGGGPGVYWTGNAYAPLSGTDGDSMAGGAGNDTYEVTASSTQQYYSYAFQFQSGYGLTTGGMFSPDQVTENPGEGTDTVQSYVSYVLPDNVENLQLMEKTYDINGTGNALDNLLTGNSHNNVLTGGAGNDTLIGGDGSDSAVFAGLWRQYGLTGSPITDAWISGSDGDDRLAGIERLQFVDGSLNTGVWTTDPTAASIARLYWGLLARAPEVDGFTAWMHALASGQINLTQAAVAFVASPEFLATYGNLDDAGFLNRLYLNVLGRPADPGGLGDWLALLAGGGSRAAVALGFTDSAEFKDRVRDRIDGGIVASIALQGSEGNDSLSGSGLNDLLIGLGGNDTLNGGAGNDTLAGGAGSDSAVFGGVWRQYTLTGNPRGSASLSGADGSDSLTGIETLKFVDGSLNFDPYAHIAEVSRLYEAALGRPGESQGLNFHSARLDAGLNLALVAQDFVFSPEFLARYGNLDDSAFVEQLYVNVLQRTADASEVQFWTDYLAGGHSRGEVVVGFSDSAENVHNHAAQSSAGVWDIDETAASVARLYWGTLGRAPDVAGLADWTSALKSGQMSLADEAAGFVDSIEFRNIYGGLDDSGFVNRLYQNVLGREADPGGLATWLAELHGGSSRANVALGFTESVEFQNRVLNQIDGGIVASSALSGSEGGELLTGSGLNDLLLGFGGNDTLAGGRGNDSLSGGAGDDQFVFDTPLDAAVNVDTLSDFASGSDRIVLDHGVFAALAAGSLGTDKLVVGAAPSAQDADDFVLYDSSTGNLSYDPDGSGSEAATLFATFINHPPLAAVDFWVS